MQDTLSAIQDLTTELLAILLLEYHNKNHLQWGSNPKKLNEEKREIVNAILDEIKRKSVKPTFNPPPNYTIVIRPDGDD